MNLEDYNMNESDHDFNDDQDLNDGYDFFDDFLDAMTGSDYRFFFDENDAYDWSAGAILGGEAGYFEEMMMDDDDDNNSEVE